MIACCVRLLPLCVLLVLAVAPTSAQPPDPTSQGPTSQGPASQGPASQAPAPPGGQSGGQPGRGVFTRPRGPQLPPRDAAASNDPLTSRVRGRVTDENGRGLRRAVVTLFVRQARQNRTALTDQDGVFEITGVAAGTYQVMATKGGYVSLSYGQRTVHGVGKPLELGVGQALDKIDLVLPRGGVITGRVVDEIGEPVAEAQVQSMRYSMMDGKRRLSPSGRNAQTDDLGQFRLYGISPGDYYVSVQVRSPMMFNPGDADVVANDSSGYAPTFAPGTTDIAEATRFTVQAGQEVTTEVQLTTSRLLRVSGTVVTSTGRPAAGGFVHLSSKDIAVGPFGSGAAIGEGGAFVLRHVAPGNYNLTAHAGEEGGFGPRRRGGENDAEVAIMPLTVAGDDLSGVRLVTGKGMSVAGVIVAEGAALPADPQLQVIAFPSERSMGLPGTGPRPVQANGQFELEGILGEARVTIINLPRGWMIKSMTYKGADVLEKPIEFMPDEGGLRIVITNRITVLTGSATRTSAAPLTDYVVLVISADPARVRATSSLRVVRPNDQGVYRIEGLAPGDYHVAAFEVAAFEGLDEETRGSAEFRQRVQGLAQQAAITDGQTRTLNLKLSTLPH